MNNSYHFDINQNKNQTIPLIYKLAKMENADDKDIQTAFRQFPKGDNGIFKKSDLTVSLIEFLKTSQLTLTPHELKTLRQNLKSKEVRSISGVTPVTVLTKPFPCPGKCIFCPNDVRMPKSYLSDEPGAQRATRNRFDPYAQTFNRLVAYKALGHSTDKIELIILGGTWTSYPEPYQIWFVKRCFDAMNDFDTFTLPNPIETKMDIPFEDKLLEEVDGTELNKTYNQIVSMAILPKKSQSETEHATWDELFNVHSQNESSETRCIGLVIETRPDEITETEVIRIRKLGATKVQIGFQSLDDEVLALNKRGHDSSVTANAVGILRRAGFKIHAHWMPNLYGSTPEKDIEDYRKIFSDPRFKPDEIKIYPCSLIASAELMQYYKKGLWKPYTHDELTHVLEEAYKLTPLYCRITRMIRDIGSQDIVVGNKKTNLRQTVEINIKNQKADIQEIRYREIRGKKVALEDLKLKVAEYDTSVSTEKFLQFVTNENQIAGFLRLSLPNQDSPHFIEELDGAAIIREIHIYGESLNIGEK
ncbi:MAG: elongator complex protein 3, partial [Patescibacteria group bacterium]|nr:elongator complex protein 3 [Patescibacteria group bacterium]